METTKTIYTGTVNNAYYQAPFDREIHVTFPDGTKQKFLAVYFDNALDFFRENAKESCVWYFNDKGEMFITMK